MAFGFSLAGLAIQAMGAVMLVAFHGMFAGGFDGMFGMMGYYGNMMGNFAGWWYAWGAVWVLAAVASLGIGFLGVVLMNSGRVGRLRSGALIVLVAAVTAFPTMWGFGLGSVLMFVGAVLGLTTAEAQL